MKKSMFQPIRSSIVFRALWRGMSIALLFMVIVFDADSLWAQSTVETFTLAGQTHVFRYETLNARIRLIRESIETTILTYQPMFDVSTAPLPFQMVILTEQDLSDLGAFAGAELRSLAEVEVPPDVRPLLTQPSICLILMGTGARDASLPFILAHEIAHCFQTHYIGVACCAAPSALLIHGWWIEAGANWLASRIFPESYLTYTRSSTAAAQMRVWRGSNLIRGSSPGYITGILWEFLTRPDQLGGPEAAIPTWKRINPATGSVAEMEQQIPDLIPRSTQAFQAFARAVAGDTIPLQVQPVRFVPVYTVSLPTSHSFPMNNFVWDAQTFVIEGLPENARVQLVMTGMYDGSEALAGLEDAALPGIWRDFAEGEPQYVCAYGGVARFTITTSRGYNAGLGERLDPLHVEMTQSDTPCSRSDSEAFACMAGTWAWAGSGGANTGLEDEREGMALWYEPTTVIIDNAGNVEFTVYGQMFRGNWIWNLNGQRTRGLMELETLGNGRYRVQGWSVAPVVAQRGSYTDFQNIVHPHTTSARARIPTPVIIHCNSPEAYGVLAFQYEEMAEGEYLRAEYWYRIS